MCPDIIDEMLAGYRAAGKLSLNTEDIAVIYNRKDPRTQRKIMAQIGTFRVNGRLHCSLESVEQHLRSTYFPGPREFVRRMKPTGFHPFKGG